MTEAARIRRNSLFSFLSAMARLFSNFVLFWLIARKYGPEIFGQFTFAQTMATNFLFLADFGFDLLLTTEVARDRTNAAKYFQQYFSLKLVCTSIALILMWGIAFAHPLSSEVFILSLIFGLFMVFSALSNFQFAFFKGYEKMEYETSVSLIMNVGLLIAVIVLVYFHTNILLISTIFLMSRVVGFSIGLYFSHKINKQLVYRFDLSGFDKAKKKIFVFGFFLLFNNLFFQLDTILIGFLKSDYDVGVYQSVFKLIILPLVLPDILTNALMPALSRFFVENKSQWEKTGYLMNKLLSIVVLPVAVILFIYPDQIVRILYGPHQYSEAIPVLRIFAITLFVRFTFEAYSVMMTTSLKQNIRMWTVIVATSMNFILNWFVIPKYGVIGAAIVSLICNSFVVTVYCIYLRHLFVKWFVSFRVLGIYVFASGLVYLAWQIKSVSIFIGSPVICFLFFVLGYWFYFDHADKKIIFSRDFGLSFINKNR